jgi:hypothetical protein
MVRVLECDHFNLLPVPCESDKIVSQRGLILVDPVVGSIPKRTQKAS